MEWRLSFINYKLNYDEEVSAKALFAGQTVKVDSLTLYSAAGVLSTMVSFLPKKSFKVPRLKIKHRKVS